MSRFLKLDCASVIRTYTVPQGRFQSVLGMEPDLTPVGEMFVVFEERPVDLRDLAF